MTVLEYNPQDPAVNANPFPIFRCLQDEAPVHWSGPLKSWIITRYEDVRRVTMDAEMSADRLRPFFDTLPTDEQRRLGDLMRYLTQWAVFRDPPEHPRLRGLMNRAFTPRSIEALRPGIAAIVHRNG